MKVDSGVNIRVKIETQDLTYLPQTLAHIILPALIQLKADRVGVPNEFSNHFQKGNTSLLRMWENDDYQSQLSFDFYTDESIDVYTRIVEMWVDVLDKMIWSFYEIMKSDWSNAYQHGRHKTTPIDYDIGLSNQAPSRSNTRGVYIKNKASISPDSKVWFDYKGQALHQQRIQEGLDLFAKYYTVLWT